MAGSEVRPPQQDILDESERRMPEGVQRTSPNGPLSELERPNQPSRLLPLGSPRSAAEITSGAGATKQSTEPLNFRQPPSRTTHEEVSIIAAGDIDDFRRWWQRRSVQERVENRSRGWKLATLPVALAALISSVFVLKGGVPSLTKAPSVVMDSNGRAKDQTPSMSSPASRAEEAGIQPSDVPSPKEVAPHDGPSTVAMASPREAQSSDTSPETSASPDVSQPPARTASEEANSAIANVRRSADLQTKRPGKLTTRVVVVANEAVARSKTADTRNQRLSIAPPAKPEEGGGPKAPQAPTAPAAAQAASNGASKKQPSTPLLQAIGDLFSQGGSRAQQPIDPITPTSGRAVQLAAKISKSEALRDLKRLNAKYGSAINGSTIGLQKALIDGEPVYRLRVVGLSKADAAALCKRLKHDGNACFVVR
jgi:SPOR domain